MVVLSATGETIHAVGIGTGPDDPMPVASISKTVAGHCAVEMARQGFVSLDATVGDILDWRGPAGEATLAQLLTHTSGFGPDATQFDFAGRNLTGPERITAIIDDVAVRDLFVPVGEFFYNNENYLILERALSTVLNDEALAWCLAEDPLLADLTSLGQNAELFAISFAGGLEISTADLARLFYHLEPADDWPIATLSETVSYGPGVTVRQTESGTILYHTGGICTLLGPNLGALGVRLEDGRSVAFTYLGCADGDDLRVLNQLIFDHLR